jgi:hypothetical protein
MRRGARNRIAPALGPLPGAVVVVDADADPFGDNDDGFVSQDDDDDDGFISEDGSDGTSARDGMGAAFGAGLVSADAVVALDPSIVSANRLLDELQGELEEAVEVRPQPLPTACD